MKGILIKFYFHLRMRQCLFFALPDIIDALVVPKKCKKEEINSASGSVPGPEPADLTKLLPSDGHEQVLCSLVDVEDLIPEQTEAGGALQGQLPQRQGCCVVVQHRVTQNEPNCREEREDRQTGSLQQTVNTTLTGAEWRRS